MTQSTWGIVDPIAVASDFLDHVVEHGIERLEVLHDCFERAISQSVKRLASLPPDDDEHPWVSGIVDDECDVVEDLLGMAFVVVQTFLKSVQVGVSDLSHTREKCGKPPLPMLASAATRKGPTPKSSVLLTRCSSMMGGSPFTEIDVMNSVANYWKHRDEWQSNWDGLRGLPNQTAMRVKVAGLSEASTGNLRAAASAFGVTDFSTLKPLRDRAGSWAQEIVSVADI